MDSLFFIAAGGALGALCRYGAGLLAVRLFGSSFPVGTLAVNVAGSFLIGAVFAAASAGPAGPLTAFVMQGFCGALTTFSTFSLDTFRLFAEGRTGRAVANVTLNMVLSLGAAALGLFLFSGTQAIH